MGNRIVQFEIGCRDTKKTQEFYSGLFDWKFEPMGRAVIINPGEGVNGHINALGHEPHRYTIFSFESTMCKRIWTKQRR
jgi:predicted enzyme related to lactoylglutathione lyase